MAFARHLTTGAKFMRFCIALLCTGWMAVAGSAVVHADDSSKAITTARTPWTTSRFQGTPEPPAPFIARRVFETLQFREPVDWALEPGTGMVYVLQLNGQLFRFNPRLAEPQAVLVDDVKNRVSDHNHSYGLEFHPRYVENRQIFLCYTRAPDQENGTRVSRFRMTDGDNPSVDAASEEILMTWHSGGHNGGCLKFGPDGFLYITAGDGTGPFPPDSASVGQNLSDLRSKIMRIDVDRPGTEQKYSIPADNPFVDLPTAKPEIWAYGFRNPWKIAFHPTRGDLYCGDVGWELWEYVFRIQKGGNYGWSVMEGRQPVRADVQRGPTPILPPLVDHKHTEARSITGGFVYTSHRLSELNGKYLYGDWVTGKVWALENDGHSVTSLQEIADTPLAIITFGLDEQGEVYLVDYAGGVYRLERNPAHSQPTTFPRKLSESGLFMSLEPLTPAPGVFPYELNAEMFMDGARAERVIAIPGTASISTGNNVDQWMFPEGTIVAKTLSLPVSDGVWQRLETQVMHHDGTEWRAYTYAWNESQSDAELVPPEGSSREVVIQTEPGFLTDAQGRRTVNWRYHSRAECLTCHMPQPNVLLGFEPVNLDRASNATGQRQLEDFARLQLFDKTRREVEKLVRGRTIVDPYDAGQNLEQRARSYLSVNCSCCHRRQGGGTAHIEFPIDHTLDKLNAIDAVPTQGTFEIPRARIIAPGDPLSSVLMYRVSTVGRGRMPHVGPRNVDELGVRLLHDWISSLPAKEEASALESPQPTVEEALKLTSAAMRLASSIADQDMDSARRQSIIDRATRESEAHIRGLFERFIPENQRRPTLGTVINAAQILAIPGDATKGRELFLHAEGIACRNCHKVGEVGRNVGPDLTNVLRQQSAAQILESIIEPSRKIDRTYVTHSVALKDGQLVTGILVGESESSVTLRDSAGKEFQLNRDDIEEDVPQPRSLMPDLLLRDLTAEDVAHLVAYLQTLAK